MINLNDLHTGNNLAFYGSHDNIVWVKIGRAIKSENGGFICENKIGTWRYLDIRSETVTANLLELQHA